MITQYFRSLRVGARSVPKSVATASRANRRIIHPLMCINPNAQYLQVGYEVWHHDPVSWFGSGFGGDKGMPEGGTAE